MALTLWRGVIKPHDELPADRDACVQNDQQACELVSSQPHISPSYASEARFCIGRDFCGKLLDCILL